MEIGLHEMGCMLGQIRQHKGISISDLCRLSGVSRCTVYKLEAGYMNMTMGAITRIANALGVRMSFKLKIKGRKK